MDGKIVEYINESGDTKILRNISKIGEGGFGIVYKALLDGFGEVAVKYQKQINIKDIKAALLEIKKAPLLEKHSIVARRIIVPSDMIDKYPMLNNPVVSVTASDILNYKIIFIYDLAVGIELFEIISIQRDSGRPFTTPTLKHYISQMLEGMIEMRNAEVIHRDIKPENIMLHNGNIKFIDFGSICETHGENKCNGMQGTDLFISPKIILASLRWSDRLLTEFDWYNADMYAIGITIMNLIGDIPFEDEDDNSFTIFSKNSIKKNYELVKDTITDILTREGLLKFLPLIHGLTSENAISPEDALHMTINL